VDLVRVEMPLAQPGADGERIADEGGRGAKLHLMLALPNRFYRRAAEEVENGSEQLDGFLGRRDPPELLHRANRVARQVIDMTLQPLRLTLADEELAVLALTRLPEARGDAEGALELERGLRRNGRLAANDLVDRLHGTAGPLGEFRLCHSEDVERLAESRSRRRDG
jgi:hypothetical protein